jgi:uncharacterized protein
MAGRWRGPTSHAPGAFSAGDRRVRLLCLSISPVALVENNMDRLEKVRQIVDAILRQQTDPDQSRAGFVHLYGVAAISTLLALRRNLDPEMCAVAGMLHDISSYKTGDPTNHAHFSALEGKRILEGLGCFSADEIERVSHTIASHGAKDKSDGPMADLLKDADVLQAYLYNPATSVKVHAELADRAHAEARLARLSEILEELGLPGRPNG